MSEIYMPGGSFEYEKAKILKTAKEDALHNLPKVASAYIRDQAPYDTPYLNLSDMQIPQNMTEVFKYCRYFYKFDSLVGAAVNSLARFPVTDIIYEDMELLPKNWDPKQDSPTLDLYRETFKETKVADELIKIGIDYWLYGNCFIMGEFGDFSQDPKKPDVRWSKLFRLDPSKMTIDLDPLTQDKTYKWEVPASVRKIVKDKKPAQAYDAIPDIIKEAVKENKAVVLNPKNIYHFSREGESGDGSVWGTPLILNVMKQLAYRNLLRQAQEAIAREHIVPFRVYYLEPSERMDPQGNWNNVASAFGKQLEQASKDPNYKVVSPVPVNVLNLGGQGRALMLTPEIDQLQAEILAGMGVPREFIFGGVSYSAASISLRTLENQFITYRLILLDFLNNFLVKRMAEVRQEWRGSMDNGYLISIKLADLKMQDDIQQKQMMINLNASNKVTDEYMYGMLGIDSDKMKAQLEIEIFERMERERRMQLYQLETQFIINQTQMQYQAQQMAMQQKLFGMPTSDPNGNPLPMTTETDDTSNEAKSSKEPVQGQKKQAQKKAFMLDDNVIEKIANWAPPQYQLDFIVEKLSSLDADKQRELLASCSESTRAVLIEKLGGNPNALGASGARNIQLNNMTELERHKALNGNYMDTGILKNLADATGQNTTENMSMPNPTQKPPNRDSLI